MNISDEINYLLASSSKSEALAAREMREDLIGREDLFEEDDISLTGFIIDDLDDIEIDSVKISNFSVYLQDTISEKLSDELYIKLSENIHKFLKGIESKFVSSLNEHKISGKIRIEKTKYNSKDDSIEVLSYSIIEELNYIV